MQSFLKLAIIIVAGSVLALFSSNNTRAETCKTSSWHWENYGSKDLFEKIRRELWIEHPELPREQQRYTDIDIETGIGPDCMLQVICGVVDHRYPFVLLFKDGNRIGRERSSLSVVGRLPGHKAEVKEFCFRLNIFLSFDD